MLRISLMLPVICMAVIHGEAQQPKKHGAWPQGTDPQEVGKRLSAHYVSKSFTNFHFKTAPTFITYTETCTWFGALRFAAFTGDTALQRALRERFEPLLGEKAHLLPVPDHVDYSVFGTVPLELYRQSGDRRYYNMGIAIADTQWNTPFGPRVTPRSLDWKAKGYSWQTRLWIDDMFMITALQSQAYRASGNRMYIDRAAREMVLYLDSLQRPNGLFFHSNEAPFYWGRGNGWMAVGMAMLLDQLPADNPHYTRIMKGYLTMMRSLLQYQTKEGMWRQLIDVPEAWIESSGSAMFTFAMITGVKNGWLKGKKYSNSARKGWIAVTSYINEAGDLTDVCEGTNIKNDKQYYLNRNKITGDLHGQAPVLWCAYAWLDPAWKK